ncbi:uncharacterized protein At5g50100, chloroplastic [Punica granatum]|uniref:Uncharacterized protein At5g50100, chloroplastic n=1 Tax=Punica granatum TaxID=22663 RepID=A0A6P8EHG5_PUNGR|nr:uncharacterized protein At5g50100, chloroplastic [Punica granatum]
MEENGSSSSSSVVVFVTLAHKPESGEEEDEERSFQEQTEMALRAAVTMSIGRQRSTSQLRFRFHRPPASPLQRPVSPPHLQAGFMGYPIRAIQGATAEAAVPKKEEMPPQDWKIKMLYDGECPLCMREVDMLRERNEDYNRINFVDISSDDYSPEENQGIDYKTAMGRIHAILSDGTVVTDVEAFRRLYEQVGLGWVYAITKYKPVGALADAVYGVWAKYRLQITGRPAIEEVLEARRKSKSQVCGDSNTCKTGSADS